MKTSVSLRHIKIKLKGKVSIIIILLIAFFLRFYGIGLAEFKGDEAFCCMQAQRMLSTGEIPLIGARGWTFVPLYTGPLLIYLVALSFLTLGPSVESGILVVTSLHLVTVYLVYKAGNKLFNSRVGLIAAFLMAISPWFVVYSRKIWSVVLLPFFATIILLTLYQGASGKCGRGKAIHFIALGIALGLSLHLHTTAYLLVPVVLSYLLVYKTSPKHFILTILAIVAAYSPILLFDASHNFVNIKAVLSHIFEPKLSRHNYCDLPTHLYNVAFYLFSLAGGTGLPSYYPEFANEGVLGYITIEPLLLCCYLVVTLSHMVKALRKRSGVSTLPKQDVLILMCLIIPLFFHLVLRGVVFPHYFIVFFPAVFLGVASFLAEDLPKIVSVSITLKSNIWKSVKKLPMASVAILSLIAVHHFCILGQFYSNVITTGGIGEYGSTLENKEMAVKYIVNDAKLTNSEYEVDLSMVRDPSAYIFLLNIIDNENKPETTSSKLWYYILEPDVWLNTRGGFLMGFLEEASLAKKIFGSVVVYKANFKL